MSSSFTKLFQSITASTIWCEPNETRIVWITLLAMADRHGEVHGSVPGIAGIARVSVDACDTAIKTFLLPDRHSRTKAHDGRRIEAIEGGWRLLNYEFYREKTANESIREAKRRWWQENRSKAALAAKTQPESSAAASGAKVEPESPKVELKKTEKLEEKLEVTRINSIDSTQAEAEADIKKKHPMSGTRKKSLVENKQELNETADRIILFLNDKCNRNYRCNETNRAFIRARLLEGATEKECKQVIVLKRRQWQDKPDMWTYLRPETLFNKTKFNQYIGELVVTAEQAA